MPHQQYREIISVPNIADGNPATALALKRQAEANDIEISNFIELTATSIMVAPFHRAITSDPEKAAKYTHESEKSRANIKAGVYACASFMEFAARLGFDDQNIPARWNVVQEHQLQGAPRIAVQKLGIEAIRLATPNVFPKESGIRTVDKHRDRAKISVWNEEAYYVLQGQGVNAELTKPYFLDAFCPDKEAFKTRGIEVVAKTSGSGMPVLWEQALHAWLAHSGKNWALHTPLKRYENEGEQTIKGMQNRTEAFFNDLGGNTHFMIGYPSELVAIACEMHERGVPVSMLTLPPRGVHEKQNLKFAIEKGLVLAEIGMPASSCEPTFKDLPQIGIEELPKILNETYDQQVSDTGVGSRPFWAN